MISHTESGEEVSVAAAVVAESTVTYNNGAEATLTCI
jgi:hypothetical protein